MSIRLALAAGAVLSLLTAGGAARAAEVGKPAPDFGGTWINHPNTTLADLRGRVVLIEFWRTW